MRPSPLDYAVAAASNLALLIVALVGAAKWSRIGSPGRWITLGYWILAVFAIAMFTMGRYGLHTKSVQEVQVLVAGVALLWGLSGWQPRGARNLFRWLLVPFVLLWIGAQLGPERNNLFSTVTAPVKTALLVAAAAVTLLTRGLQDRGLWTRQPWFWVAVGYMLGFGSEVVLYPVGSLLFVDRADLVLLAYRIHAALSVVGDLLVARGLWVAAEPADPRADFEPPIPRTQGFS